LLVGERQGDPVAYERDRAKWLDFLARAEVPVIADLRSDLHGQSRLTTTGLPLRGSIAGLERGQTAAGLVIDALVERLAALCGTQAEAEPYQLASSPLSAELLHLPRLARQLGGSPGYWEPRQLPALLSGIEPGKAVALFGRAPNWLYAGLAVRAAPAEAWLFDVRHGWMKSPSLRTGEGDKVQAGWQTEVKELTVGAESAVWLEMTTTSQYIDPNMPYELPLPSLPDQVGLVLSGKIPHWLLMSAARRLSQERPWLAVYQPQLNGVVVVHSSIPKRPIGQKIPVQPPAT
jgi:CRISPR-associated protein Csx3